MKVNLEWLRTFKAVFETGTVSGAAKELELTQPAVTTQLKALEAYTGYQLFERSTRNVQPTLYAKQLYNQVAGSLMKLESVESKLRHKGGKGDRVTLYIGIYPGLFRQLFVPNIRKLDCNVVVTLNDNETLKRQLENGATDLIITTKEIPNRNILYEPLGESCFVLVAGSATDLSGFTELDMQNKKQVKRWLQKQEWYNTAYGENLSTFWKLNFGKELDLVPNYIIPDKFSILGCLLFGTGLAVLPESLCYEAIGQGSVVELWKGYVEMKNTLYIGQRKNTLHVDKMEELKQMLKAEFQRTHEC